MTKPDIIIPANHKTVVDLTSGYIRDYQNRLITGLEVLSAVTGRKCLKIPEGDNK